MLQPFDSKISADRFIKERLSLIEIGFRQHESFVAGLNAKLAENVTTADCLTSAASARAFGYPATAPMG